MNLSGGFKALGQGLQLISEQNFRREERDWMAMREENLARLRHTQNLEVEGVRAENDRQERDAQRRHETLERAKDRKAQADRDRENNAAADARLDRSDNRADARLERQQTDQDRRELIELRRSRPAMLMRFRDQIREAESDFAEAQTNGADESRLAILQAALEEAQIEADSWNAETIDRMAALGDDWAKSQVMTDPPGGGEHGAAPGPKAAVASPRAKPMQSQPAGVSPRAQPYKPPSARERAEAAQFIHEKSEQQRRAEERQNARTPAQRRRLIEERDTEAHRHAMTRGHGPGLF